MIVATNIALLGLCVCIGLAAALAEIRYRRRVQRSIDRIMGGDV